MKKIFFGLMIVLATQAKADINTATYVKSAKCEGKDIKFSIQTSGGLAGQMIYHFTDLLLPGPYNQFSGEFAVDVYIRYTEMIWGSYTLTATPQDGRIPLEYKLVVSNDEPLPASQGRKLMVDKNTIQFASQKYQVSCEIEMGEECEMNNDGVCEK